MMRQPVVLLLPGASLMRIRLLAGDRVRVECPGCGAFHIFRARVCSPTHRPFRHHGEDCPVLVKIDRALLTVPEPTGRPVA